MIHRTFVVLGLMAILCTPALADKSQDDLKAMEGTWLPTSGEVGGNPFPEEELKKLKLVVKGDAYTVSADGKDDKGTVKLDATKTPKQMDIMGIEGENKDEKFLAIYELIDKDTLKACYALSGDRPTEFKTVADDGRVVLTFKRQKP